MSEAVLVKGKDALLWWRVGVIFISTLGERDICWKLFKPLQINSPPTGATVVIHDIYCV